MLDRDRRRQAGDRIDVGPRKAIEELLCVGRDRFDVPALPLGVQRVECERGLSAAGDAGDDGELAPGQVEIEVLEVVLACAAHADRIEDFQAPLRVRVRRSVSGAESGPNKTGGDPCGSPPCDCARSKEVNYFFFLAAFFVVFLAAFFVAFFLAAFFAMRNHPLRGM